MHLTREVKTEIFRRYTGSETNTDSTGGQIVLFTLRINHLTEYLKVNRKDFNTERSLVKLAGKRRSLLGCLKNTDIERCRAIIKELNIGR